MKEIPKTIEEAIQILSDEIPKQDKRDMATCSRNDLIIYHHTLGRDIRNEFKLWEGNDELVKDASRFTNYSVSHPDSISMVIIEKFWEKIRDCY